MNRRQMQQIIRAAERNSQGQVSAAPQPVRETRRGHQSTINTSRKISDLVDLLDGPAAGAIRALVEKDNQDKLMRALKQVSKATASPPTMDREISKRMAQKAKPAAEIGRGHASAAGEETIEELVSMLIEAGIDSYM